jgi:hypothetical protein
MPQQAVEKKVVGFNSAPLLYTQNESVCLHQMHEIDLVAFAEYVERICVLSKIMGSEVDLHQKNIFHINGICRI